MYRRIMLLTAAIIVVAPIPALAEFIHVKADGTGDYEVLQEGLDAAADGDTVMVWPGRYDDFIAQTNSDGYEAAVIGFISTPNLLLIGTDRSGVVIGPASPMERSDGLGTVALSIDAGATGVQIMALTVENTSLLVGDRQGCRMGALSLRNPTHSIYIATTPGLGDVSFINCTFECTPPSVLDSGPYFGVFVPLEAQGSGLLVEDCEFVSCPYAIQVDGISNVTIRRTSFSGSVLALNMDSIGSGLIESCAFRQSGSTHLTIGSSTVEIVESQFGPDASRALFVGGSTVSATRCRFGGTRSATVRIHNADVEIHESEILHGSSYYSVSSQVDESYGVGFIDFRHNWWGTTDSDQIAAWIEDESRDPLAPSTVPVVYAPYRGQRVATEATSMGQLKSRYAPR